ncbi:transposase family protein [Brucella pseudogrignonensis]|uniref:integrase catalytic domain-containing protein n=1 Tax=Brucella pseudogrignonensis TaxID=419475 RepID=UPI003857B749
MPSRPNAQWSLDSVSGAFSDGNSFRMLTVVDDFTQVCMALFAETFPSRRRFTRNWDAIITRRGWPRTTISDKGTDMTSSDSLKGCKDIHVQWH